MDDIRFKDRTELRQYISDHMVKPLGVGREGQCTLLDNGLVIKYLYRDYYPQFALQFKDLYIPSLIFARYGAFVEDYVGAVFMDYAKGDALLDRIPLEQSLDVLGDHLNVLVDGIKKASEMGIYAKDFHCGNILYDLNQFKIVDTLSYLRFDNYTYEKDNIYEIMNPIFAKLLSEIIDYNKEIGFDLSFFGNLDYLKNPKEYLQLLKSRIETITDQEVTTLKDASMSLRKKVNR